MFNKADAATAARTGLVISARTGEGIEALRGQLLVLAGWYFQNASLVRLHPGFGPMQPQTALGILLSGASLAAAQQGWRRVSGLLAGLVLLLGLLTCCEHIFGVDMGVGQLLSIFWTAPPEYKLGRMAPGTAAPEVAAVAAAPPAPPPPTMGSAAPTGGAAMTGASSS